MAITLDTSKGDNTISVVLTLPNNIATHTVVLEFQSDYDKQTTLRHLNVTQEGEWIIGVIDSENIPYTGNYKVAIHTSVEDFLALNEIVRSLDEISNPLNDLRGPSKDVLLDIIRAIILGTDWPYELQDNIVSTTITQNPATNTSVTQNTSIDTIVTEPIEIDTNIATEPAIATSIAQIIATNLNIVGTQPIDNDLAQTTAQDLNIAQSAAESTELVQTPENDTTIAQNEALPTELVTYRD